MDRLGVPFLEALTDDSFFEMFDGVSFTGKCFFEMLSGEAFFDDLAEDSLARVPGVDFFGTLLAGVSLGRLAGVAFELAAGASSYR